MHLVLLLLGLTLLVLAIVDLLWTTLWVDGAAGPVAARLTTWLWRALRRLGRGRPRALGLAGPLILSATLLAWVAMLWAGWTLVFGFDAGALRDTIDHEPIDWTARFYFVGYAMFTMGNGDFAPEDGAWQIAAALCTASGMMLVTMAVSYVLSVLGAVATRRAFASSVTRLGERSETLVASGWSGHDFAPLEPTMSTWAMQLGALVEQHQAYPILHYYHSEQARDASAVAIAVLDDAMTLLRFGVPEACRPNPVLLESLRASIGFYLETLASAFIDPSGEPPPPPELARLREQGLPAVPDEAFRDALEGLAQRRQKLLAMVEADAWPWPPRVDPGAGHPHG